MTAVRTGSSNINQRFSIAGRNQISRPALLPQENNTMIIYTLALAMCLFMLIATLFSLHQEAEQVRLKEQADRSKGFGHYRR